MSVTLYDFLPNKWEQIFEAQYVDEYGSSILNPQDGEEYTLNRDCSTQKTYLYQSKQELRQNAFELLLGGTLISSTWNVFKRIINILSFQYLQISLRGSPKEYTLKERTIECGKDALRILSEPVMFCFKEAAALIGIITPNYGMKLFASLERLQYGHGEIAPCYQPLRV